MVTGKDFWGPSTWDMIHLFAAHYKSNNAVYFKQFISCMAFLLPCKECRLHLQQNLAILPVDTRSKSDLFFWTYNLHDVVNKQINRRQTGLKRCSPSYESVKHKYFNTDIRKFGRSLWVAFHSICLAYTRDNKDHFVKFLRAFIALLPSDQWSQNTSSVIVDFPPTRHFDSNDDLFFWSYFVHNKISCIVRPSAVATTPSYNYIKTYYERALKDDCSLCRLK
jgi:hypothetical protein